MDNYIRNIDISSIDVTKIQRINGIYLVLSIKHALMYAH